MFGSKRIIVVNIGASTISMAQFEDRGKNKPLMVTKAGEMEMGVSPEHCGDKAAYVVVTLRDLMGELGIPNGSKTIVLVSDQLAFPRFILLPPVSEDKLAQIICYEAEQNIPFPMADIVWDYRLIGDVSGEGQRTLIVAIKDDAAREVVDCVLSAGLKPKNLSITAVALSDLLMPSDGGCQMVIDAGARSTGIVFVENGKSFFRCVPVAGNAITQEISRNLSMEFHEAEAFKRSGIPAIGYDVAGVTPSDVAEDNQTKAARRARAVVTRIHAELSRTVNFYRSQQGGEAPVKILTCGGTSRLPGFNDFFQSKFGIPVENLSCDKEVTHDNGVPVVCNIATMTGAALSHFGRRQKSVNLMPPKHKPKLRRERNPIQWPSGGIIGMAIFAATFVAGAMFMLSSNGTATVHRVKASLSVGKEVGGRLLGESTQVFSAKVLEVFASAPKELVDVESTKTTASRGMSLRNTTTLTASGTLKKDSSGSYDKAIIWVASATERLSKMGMKVSMDISVGKDGEYSFSIAGTR